MATSPSPPASPTMGPTHHPNSPPQQLSKRDKRRTMISDRLVELSAQFSSNRDAHYREYLQAIQISINLILESDVHSNEPLPDSLEEIDRLIEEQIRKHKIKTNGIPQGAGRQYKLFLGEVNDAKEKRDAELASAHRAYTVKMNQLLTTDAYRRKVAGDELRALRNTVRDRLINSVTNKKARLSRDKDMTEITEINPLLLHPSQYGLANPASPGGLHGKRATRHRRDLDEATAFGDSNKRKRKAVDSDESPAPTRQRIDGTNTPIWFAEKKLDHSIQVESNLYSVDKLFTEKELAMTYTDAALAAHRYIVRHQPYDDGDDSLPNGTESNSDIEKPVENLYDEETPPAEAPSMERQYSHATRSTRGGGVPNFSTTIGIDIVTDLNYPGNMDAITQAAPKLPPALLSVMAKPYGKFDTIGHPAPLTAEEVSADMDVMKRARRWNQQSFFGSNLREENGGRELLEAVVATTRYQHFVRSDVNDRGLLAGIRGEFSSENSVEPSMAGSVPMSRSGTNEGTQTRPRRAKAAA